MKIELATDLTQLMDFAEGWDRLAEEFAQPRAGAAPVVAWARHMMDSDAELRIWFATEGNEVIGVLPFVAECLPRGRERLLPPATAFMYGSIPMAQADREPEIASALVAELAGSLSRVDLLGIYWVRQNSPWIDAFEKTLTGPEWVALEPSTYRSFYVDLEGGFETWLESREYKFRKESRRRVRRYEDEGFRLFSSTEPAEIIRRLPSIQTLYRDRQLQRGGEGYCFDHKMSATIRDAVSAAESGKFRLVTLERDGTVMAMQMSLQAGHRISGWMTGFDANWSRLGPGIAVITAALRAGADAGGVIVDLGVGDQSYKGDFVDGEFMLETRIWSRPRMAKLLQLT